MVIDNSKYVFSKINPAPKWKLYCAIILGKRHRQIEEIYCKIQNVYKSTEVIGYYWHECLYILAINYYTRLNLQSSYTSEIKEASISGKEEV